MTVYGIFKNVACTTEIKLIKNYQIFVFTLSVIIPVAFNKEKVSNAEIWLKRAQLMF